MCMMLKQRKKTWKRSSFVKHEPCPMCHSKDNLARYDDGSAYCFGCGYVERPGRRILTPKLEEKPTPALPPDAAPLTTGKGLEWVSKYEITAEEIFKNNILWSESRQMVIFPIFVNGLVAWQGRNFDPTRKYKYFSQGKIHDILDLVSYSRLDKCGVVLCEDKLSAIKVGRVSCAMPLYGSNASETLLRRLKTVTPTLTFWLDSDKLLEALKQARKASILGFKTHVIDTPCDPKEYTTDEIRKKLFGE